MAKLKLQDKPNIWVDSMCRHTMELMGCKPVFKAGHDTIPGSEYPLPRGTAQVQPRQCLKDAYFVAWDDLGAVIDLLCDSGVDWLV